MIYMNIFCLMIWIGWMIHGICNVCNGKPVNIVAYFCAVAICILDYLIKIFENR